MWLGSGQQINQVNVSDILILSSSVKIVESAQDLGVIIDSHLSLSSHVAGLCRSEFYHLRQLRPLCRSLPAEATKTLVHAGVHFMLPGLLQRFAVYRVTDKLMRQVQSVQNAAARLITGAKRREHITPIWRQLRWLPVRRRVEFKMASLVYQVLSSKVPLADDIHLASESSACSHRSSSERKCSVTRVHSRFGDRCFAAAGPRIWNNLPTSLRDKEVSCTEFRKQLKTFMFQTDCGAS